MRDGEGVYVDAAAAAAATSLGALGHVELFAGLDQAVLVDGERKLWDVQLCECDIAVVKGSMEISRSARLCDDAQGCGGEGRQGGFVHEGYLDRHSPI